MKPKYLSMFTWTDDDTDGNHDLNIGKTNNIGELDLSDDEAKNLVRNLVDALFLGEHVTLRIRKEYDS